jgi:predicted MFS family arabinose efflux permease
MAIELLGSHKEQIGNIRIGGSIGWGVSVIATGLVLKYFPIRSVFFCYQILILFCFILSFYLPNIKKERICSKSKTVTTIHRSRVLILIFISVFIWGTGEKCITDYLFLHMDLFGTSTFIMGSSMAFAIVGEMVALRSMEMLIRKFGYDKLFFMGFVLQSLRLLSLSFFSNSVIILITQLIGGASFSLIWVSSVARVDTLAPDEEKTMAQGLRTGFQNGFGGAFGALLGGLLFMNFGAQMLYRIMGLLLCFGVLLLLLAGKKETNYG